MVNSVFDREESEAERTVILSERHGGENSPTFFLLEEVIGAAFQAHPYRHMVIGYQEDLETITRDDLFAHGEPDHQHDHRQQHQRLDQAERAENRQLRGEVRHDPYADHPLP